MITLNHVEGAGEFAVDQEAVARLSKDLKVAVATLTPREVRYLTSAYYQLQDYRIRATHQASKFKERNEPHDVTKWFWSQFNFLEGQIKAALDKYSYTQPAGVWLRSNTGIGAIISSGLLAYLDPEKPHVGHWWSLAGLNPTAKWLKGEKRPWNSDLKSLCWNLGQSFIKFQAHPKCFYGHLYARRKLQEIAWNDQGKNTTYSGTRTGDQLGAVGEETLAWAWYTGCFPAGACAEYFALEDLKAREQFVKSKRGETGSGIKMLPPAHVTARAQRWTVKLCLDHLHKIWSFIRTGHLPEKPYVFSHLHHADLIAPPNVDVVKGLREAYASDWGVSV